MVNNVQFPGLGIELEVNRVAFEIGGLQLYWYGILIALGLLLGASFALWKSKSYGINDDRFVDAIFIVAILSILGARLYYVIFAPFKYESIMQVFDIRDGGLAIYGAVIVAFVTTPFVCKWRKVPIMPALDLAAMGFLIGQSIGRWGNFMNQEAFGTNTNLPWGMISENTVGYLSNMQQKLEQSGIIVDPNLPVHPTFLYESLWCALGFFLLWAYSNRRKFNGEIFLLYIVWYGVERAFVEGLRTDSLNLGVNLRVSQVVAIISAIVAFAIWVKLRKKYKGKPLMISYDFLVYPKQKKSPTVNITWKLGEAMPTQNEIVDIFRWSHLPVGVWHVEDDVMDQDYAAVKQVKQKTNALKEILAEEIGENETIDEPVKKPDEVLVQQAIETDVITQKAEEVVVSKELKSDDTDKKGEKETTTKKPAKKSTTKKTTTKATTKKTAPKKATTAKTTTKKASTAKTTTKKIENEQVGADAINDNSKEKTSKKTTTKKSGAKKTTTKTAGKTAAKSTRKTPAKKADSTKKNTENSVEDKKEPTDK